MNFTVDSTSSSTNFKAKLLLQGNYEKPRFWSNVAKNFEQMTAKKPNKYCLLEFGTFDDDVVFSNIDRNFSSCSFKDNFCSKDFYKLGAKKIAKMFVDITELLDKNSNLRKMRSNKPYNNPGKIAKEINKTMRQMEEIKKSKLIKQYVCNIG